VGVGARTQAFEEVLVVGERPAMFSSGYRYRRVRAFG
jgi:hypothetical protein